MGVGGGGVLQVKGFLGALWLEEEELGHNNAGGVVGHGAHQADDPVLPHRGINNWFKPVLGIRDILVRIRIRIRTSD